MKLRSLGPALVALWLLGTAAPSMVRAEDPPKAEKKRGKRRNAKPARRHGEVAHQEGAPKPAAETGPKREKEPSKAASDAARAAQDAAHGVDSQIVKEGDTSVKVMSFTGLDIEGRLKSPQLLYFVNRVHAEFERPKLPHRSFMPELERSTQRDPLR
jgi:hypothetical protein